MPLSAPQFSPHQLEMCFCAVCFSRFASLEWLRSVSFPLPEVTSCICNPVRLPCHLRHAILGSLDLSECLNFYTLRLTLWALKFYGYLTNVCCHVSIVVATYRIELPCAQQSNRLPLPASGQVRSLNCSYSLAFFRKSQNWNYAAFQTSFFHLAICI